ncbi:nitric oxide synthase [Denitromonas ohlonensis]|uniref:Nitric oxide synthase n=3 Tax=Denitromonas TaxID=139331 RepID=A0A557RNP0_9RHOO|nr:nitric oxide synthase [Denitromonas ohlonensis]TVO79664.1 nitric oxide synthase [Denitromonas ohlonensis]
MRGTATCLLVSIMTVARFRSVLRQLHRWIALVLTPVFVLVILSGAVLALKPVLTAAPAASVSVSAETVAEALVKIDPRGRATGVIVSPDASTLRVTSKNPVGPSGQYAMSTGELTASQPGPDVFAVVLDLHKNLLLGLSIVVEIAAYAMTVLIVMGLLLGLPRLRNTLAGWHLGIGWLALPLVLLAPLTGALMALHIGGAELPPVQAGPPVALSTALTRVAEQVDGATVLSARRFRGGSALVFTAGAEGQAVRMVQPDGSINRLTEGPGLVHELHEGTWGGVWSAGISFVGALALAGLTGTGAWGWWRRRRQQTAGSADAGARTLVAFGSQTGTAARLAEATAQALRQAGEKVACASLEALQPAALAGYEQTLLIVSTTGEGELPDPARRFMQGVATTDLAGSRFSMLALGDRRYANFCRGGEQLRGALLGQGARELAPIERADGEPVGAWRQWLDRVATLLGHSLEAVDAPASDLSLSLTLVDRQRLDNPAVAGLTETWQLSFWAGDWSVEFRPGDLLLIAPTPEAAPRCYSIGSSSRVGDSLIRLTVSLHHWRDSDGQTRVGAASGYLCHELPEGARISASLRAHPQFNPPEDVARPLILVAAGAGIAPFPGFLAERAAHASAGPTWLFFGNRQRAGDFFYRDALTRWQDTGTLTRLDTAFSRDADDGAYIDRRLIAHGAELYRWLAEENGVLYMCGRSATLGRSVDAALLDIIRTHGRTAPAEADAILQAWKQNGTLQVDVFG